MINEQPAVVINQNATGDRRRFVTTVSTAIEGPPRSADLSGCLVVAIILGLVVALVTG